MKAVFKTTGGGKQPNNDGLISFAAGERIFQEGELGTEMFIVQDGVVKIVKKLAGEAHVLSVLEKGDFFGEMAVIEGAPRSADAVADTDVRLIVINGSRFDEMLRSTPEIAIRIIRKYSRRLREANRLLEQLAGPEFEKHTAALEKSDEEKEPVARTRDRLVDVATGNAFYFSQGDESTIGRSDPVTGILPDVDLTAVDTNRSVSRRHAKIVRRGEDGFAILEEVGTVNGTFVNDQRIPTGVPVPIGNGDRVRIGLVNMKVILER